MQLFLILGGVIIILGLICYISIKGNISKSKVIKQADKVKKKSDDVIKQREKIRDEQNATEDKINTDDSIITDGIMPIIKKPKHNHSLSKPCTKSCPAYTGK